jgi:thioredoxin 1
MSESRHVLPVTTSTFDAVVLGSDRPVVVDFWAAWCGPCIRLAPLFHELAGERPDVRFVSVDVDAEPSLAQRFGITSIPTMKFFRDGSVAASHTGGLTKEQLRQRLDAFASAAVPAGSK